MPKYIWPQSNSVLNPMKATFASDVSKILHYAIIKIYVHSCVLMQHRNMEENKSTK